MPRLVSLKGFQDLFEVQSQHGQLKKDQVDQALEIANLKKDIEAMKKRTEQVAAHSKYLHQDALDHTDKTVDNQRVINDDFNKKFKDQNKKIKLMDGVQKAVQAKATEQRSDHEMLESSMTRFRDDVTAFRTEVFSTIRGTKDDLQEQITSSDKYFGELTQQLSDMIKDVRELATTEMRKQEKELVDRFSGQFNEVHEYMTSNVEAIKKAAEDSHAKFFKSVQSIKKVCSNYFSKYE